MAGSQHVTGTPGRTSLRRCGPILFLLVVQMFMTTSTLAARPYGTTRVLLQTQDNLITDYIGASGSSIQFTDAPIDSGVHYVFPLAFAIDADANGNAQNGQFSAYWSSSLTPQAAQSYVQANPDVRLSVSLAGFSQFISSSQTSQNINWYDPADVNTWVSNAVSSITSLAQQYSLSGIDIDYENFPGSSSTFTQCIGQLITQLKNTNIVTFASIAPFGGTTSHYQDLFSNYASVIDYVNYQFYADGLSSASDYATAFNAVAANYDASKVLLSVEANGRGLQGSDFITAAQQISNLPGIMIFDVDNDESTGFATLNAVNSFVSS